MLYRVIKRVIWPLKIKVLNRKIKMHQLNLILNIFTMSFKIICLYDMRLYVSDLRLPFNGQIHQYRWDLLLWRSTLHPKSSFRSVMRVKFFVMFQMNYISWVFKTDDCCLWRGLTCSNQYPCKTVEFITYDTKYKYLASNT